MEACKWGLVTAKEMTNAYLSLKHFSGHWKFGPKKINGLIQKKKFKWALGLDAYMEQMMCSPRWSGHIKAHII